MTTGDGAAAHLSYVDAQTGKVLKDVIESKLDSVDGK